MANPADPATMHPWIRPRHVGPFLHRLVTYDVFPDFSAHVRRLLYNPLGVLLLAAFTALLCGLFLHPQGFVLLGGVGAVVVLGVCWPWLTTRGLSGQLTFDRCRTSEGDPVETCLTVRNGHFWSALGLVVRRGFPRTTSAEDPPVACIASLPRRQTSRCRWTFTPTSRGAYPLAPPRLATGFPFGLWENGTSLTAPTRCWSGRAPTLSDRCRWSPVPGRWRATSRATRSVPMVTCWE